MDGESERIALLRRVYDAFNRRDIDAVLATLDPDVDWPNLLDGTRVIGHAAVREYWRRQFEVIDPRVEPTAFVEDGDRIVVDVHQVVRDLAGTVIRDSRVAHAYTFRGGLIAAMHVYPTVAEARN